MILLTLVTATACSSSQAPSQFLTNYFDALCEYNTRCHWFPDTATCLASTQGHTTYLETMLADIDAGKVKYSASAANGCVDAIEALTACPSTIIEIPTNTTIDGLPTVCSDVFTGTVGSGGACSYTPECIANYPCQYTDTSCDSYTTCCVGTCVAVPLVPVGDSCLTDLNCVTGAYCSQVTSTCKQIATAAGDECEGPNGCAAPLQCTSDQQNGQQPEPTGTCYLPPAEGAPCDLSVHIPCGDLRDYCDLATNVCTPVAGVGSACGVAPSYTDCVLYASCTNATCVALGALGSACTIGSGGDSTCLPELSCNNGKCTLPAAGSACK